ncbi:MAG: DUF4838 domain-containing protein [Pirellulales bacterium]|nr:DUF4838 domain-containing protein [Pirellulales bacterium]
MKKTLLVVVGLMSAAVLPCSIARADLTLVADGEGKAVIVLADAPSVAAKHAAELLAAQIGRISGAKLPVVRESALGDVKVEQGEVRASISGLSPEVFILVGESGLARRLGATAEGLGPGGILQRTFANALVLLGPEDKHSSDPDGTRYAVTTFLEDVLGFRFLWPGELGLVAPARRTVSVPALDKKFTPRIGQRKIRNAHYNDRVQAGLDYLGVKKEDNDKIEALIAGRTAQAPDWFAWQRLGGNIGLVGGHAYGYVWDKYHREHPEWFAMQPNGSRDLSKLTPERARLCKSNLALVEAIARDKIAELDRGSDRSVSLSPNDGGLACFCMCPDCKNLDPPEGRPITLWDNSSGARGSFEYVSLTDRMVWFFNQLATRITAKHPDAWLTVYAYSAYKAPPVREKLHPNLAVGLVGMDYRSDAQRQETRDDWDAWARATKKLYWRPNLLLFSRREGTPSLYAHKLAEDFAYFADHSLLGTDFDSCMHHWATEGLNYYVLARLLWNPDENVDAILDDYCRSGFGGACSEVRRYFARIEALTNEIAKGELAVTVPYTPAVIAELSGILDSAERAETEEVVRRRVRFLRRGLEFTALQHRTHDLAARGAVQTLTADEKSELARLQQEKLLVMRRIFREEPLAVNVAMVAWGSEGVFRKFGWKGAGSVPKAVVDADEEGRPVEGQGASKK